MTSHSAALAYIDELNSAMASLTTAIHEVFVSQGCTSYVKTIYIGYDLGGEMVAALYAHADHIEVALALPEDAEGELLVDASHLTWRTLPVAAIIRSTPQVDELETLVRTATERVRSREHAVLRDNDFFIRSRRDRKDAVED